MSGGYCKHCDINWSRVHEDCTGGEAYEYCPQCKSGMHLVNKKPGKAFFMQLDGKIFNSKTLKEVKPPPVELPPMPEQRKFSRKFL